MFIYKFTHEGNTYIGSTKDMVMRLHSHNQHKKQARHNGTKFYKYCNEAEIHDIRPYVEVLEEIEDDYDKTILRNLEQDYIDEYKPNLNMVKAMKR